MESSSEMRNVTPTPTSLNNLPTDAPTPPFRELPQAMESSPEQRNLTPTPMSPDWLPVDAPTPKIHGAQDAFTDSPMRERDGSLIDHSGTSSQQDQSGEQLGSLQNSDYSPQTRSHSGDHRPSTENPSSYHSGQASGSRNYMYGEYLEPHSPVDHMEYPPRYGNQTTSVPSPYYQQNSLRSNALQPLMNPPTFNGGLHMFRGHHGNQPGVWHFQPDVLSSAPEAMFRPDTQDSDAGILQPPVSYNSGFTSKNTYHSHNHGPSNSLDAPMYQPQHMNANPFNHHAFAPPHHPHPGLQPPYHNDNHYSGHSFPHTAMSQPQQFSSNYDISTPAVSSHRATISQPQQFSSHQATTSQPQPQPTNVTTAGTIHQFYSQPPPHPGPPFLPVAMRRFPTAKRAIRTPFPPPNNTCHYVGCNVQGFENEIEFQYVFFSDFPSPSLTKPQS